MKFEISGIDEKKEVRKLSIEISDDKSVSQLTIDAIDKTNKYDDLIDVIKNYNSPIIDPFIVSKLSKYLKFKEPPTIDERFINEDIFMKFLLKEFAIIYDNKSIFDSLTNSDLIDFPNNSKIYFLDEESNSDNELTSRLYEESILHKLVLDGKDMFYLPIFMSIPKNEKEINDLVSFITKRRIMIR